MEDNNLPEDINNLPEAVKAMIQSTTDYMENVVFPMWKFVYPEPSQLFRAIPKTDFQYREFEFETAILEGDEIKTEHKSASYFIEDLGQDIILEMVYIPGGSFMMGSSENAFNISEHEIGIPQHQVDICAFHIGKFEITQKQWEAIMHHNLSANQGAELPVENVSWNDAVEFCRRLSIITGRSYRLPSEAEWEYACRAGTTTPFSFGSKLTTQLANYWDINATDDSVQQFKTMGVGSFFPNAFGLYDMHGNVYELCQDAWHENYDGAPNDGSAWGSGKDTGIVVVRGGSFDYYDENCRSATRSETESNYRYYGTGFRVVCPLNY